MTQTRINLFEPIITVFLANGERNNLLSSVILEMFHFLSSSGMRLLLDDFMEKQYHRVEDVDIDQTFAVLKLKWEQMRERPSEPGTPSAELNTARKQKDPRALDRGKSTKHFKLSVSDPSTAKRPSSRVSRKEQPCFLYNVFQEVCHSSGGFPS